jgi:hypothetical protein
MLLHSAQHVNVAILEQPSIPAQSNRIMNIISCRICGFVVPVPSPSAEFSLGNINDIGKKENVSAVDVTIHPSHMPSVPLYDKLFIPSVPLYDKLVVAVV